MKEVGQPVHFLLRFKSFMTARHWQSSVCRCSELACYVTSIVCDFWQRQKFDLFYVVICNVGTIVQVKVPLVSVRDFVQMKTAYRVLCTLHVHI